MIYYISTHVLLTILSIGMLLFSRKKSKLLDARYWRWLLSSWKIITFILATVALSAIAPISWDPTWDIPETIIMCGLTFLIAPWAVAVIYRAIFLYELDWQEMFIAIVFSLFCSSWSYDLYVWAWLGSYPESWLGNLLISPILFACAGAFWNLEYREGKWAVFAFREKVWIESTLPEWQPRLLFPYFLPFFLLWVAIFWGFLYVNM